MPLKLQGMVASVYVFVRDYRVASIGGLIVLLFLLMGLLAPWVSPKDPNAISLQNALQSPGKEFLLGTDWNGRDLLSRIIYGARVSLSIAFAAVSAGAVVGIIFGTLAGWYKRLENLIMRLIDVLLCFPGIIVALAIIAVLGPSLINLIIAIAIYRVPQTARLAHGLTLSAREKDYVKSAVSIGASDRRIILRHIIPNIMAPLIVQISLMLPGAIMTVAGLSFLGLGLRPPTAEWGSILRDSTEWFHMAPHVMIFPGLALMLVVFGFNTLGDGLRDFLDPRTGKM